MQTWQIVLLIVLVVVAAILVALYFVGRKLQKRQDEQQEAINNAAQQMELFIIDKKKMKITEAGLPKIVVDQTPKYLRRAKVPVVKAKIGPRVMSFMADNKVYDALAPNQTVKATVSGIYITQAKRLRGPVVESDPKKRKALEKAAKKEAKKKAKEAK